MAFTTQYVICNISTFNHMYSLSEYLAEFRTSKMDLFVKIVHGYVPSTVFIKNSVSDVPLGLNTTLQIASHY